MSEPVKPHHLVSEPEKTRQILAAKFKDLDLQEHDLIEVEEYEAPADGVTKCQHRPSCVMDWISTRRKSPTTSPSTGGVNESIGGSCFLLIIMLDIICYLSTIDLWFTYNLWILD